MQGAFTVVNARIGIEGPDDSWGVELWAQNLFNENYLQVGFDAPVQGSGTTRGVQAGFYPASTQLYGGFLGEPRTFGVTLHGKATFSGSRRRPMSLRRLRRRRPRRRPRPAPTARSSWRPTPARRRRLRRRQLPTSGERG